MNAANCKIGTKVVFDHPLSDGGMLRFSARVVKLAGENAYVEMPARVRAIPFPPLGGKRYGLFPIAKLVAA